MKIPIPRIVRAVAHEVRVRRDVRHLEEFSDRMLADIGMSRSGIDAAVRGRPWRRFQ
jgi:uncharacterized protein YjiS (DUF1127 family)